MTTFSADMRAAAVTLLTNYVASVSGLRCQIYPARPRTIAPPTAFVDGFTETIDNRGIRILQRHPAIDVIVIHGVFDSKEAADQRDDFVDGFIDWVKANAHAAGANTTIGTVGVDDIPTFTPDWIQPGPDGRFPAYYATRLTLEGLEANS